MSDRIEYKYKSYGGYITEVSKKEEYKFDLKQALKDGGYISKDGLWNSIMQDTDGKLYRVAVETIVVNKDRVFCQVKKNNTLKFPGGSTERGLTYEEQAKNECREEARINVRNIIYTGKIHKDSKYRASWWSRLPVMYDGKVSYIYIALYDSKYTGYIDKADRDDLLYKGKWSKITDILQYANPEQKEVLENYLSGEYISKRIVPPDNKSEFALPSNMIIEKDNLYINMDEWKPGNPLFITGASGDGKSTLAEKMGKENDAIVCQTDVLLARITCTKYKFDQRKEKYEARISDLDKEFIYSHPDIPWPDHKLTPEERPEAFMRYYNQMYVDWIVNESRTNPKYKNKKVIIEGCDLALLDPKVMSTKPMIIFGGSRLKNLFRRMKRSMQHGNNLIVTIFDQIKYMRSQNQLDNRKFRFYNNIQKAMSEEAIAADTEDDITIYDYPIPDIVPYYTPSDLLIMGVFNEDEKNNFYGVKSTMESKEWFDQYSATGYPGEGYLSKLQKLLEEYELSPTLENKQRILEFGWNPNIKINPNVEKRMKIIRQFLMEQYGVTIVDCTELFD